jgi:hypothetical protein
MKIKLGQTGPVLECAGCGETIEATEDGYVLWNRGEADAVVVHQGRCDPGSERYSSSRPLSEVLR